MFRALVTVSIHTEYWQVVYVVERGGGMRGSCVGSRITTRYWVHRELHPTIRTQAHPKLHAVELLVMARLVCSVKSSAVLARG